MGVTSLPRGTTLAKVITDRIESIIPGEKMSSQDNLVEDILDEINNSLYWTGVEYRILLRRQTR